MGRSKSLIFLIMIGCGHCRDYDTNPVSYDATCSDICIKLNKMGCEHGEPLPDGTSCEEFCLDTTEFGHKIDLDCIMARVERCSDMEELESVCE